MPKIINLKHHKVSNSKLLQSVISKRELIGTMSIQSCKDILNIEIHLSDSNEKLTLDNLTLDKVSKVGLVRESKTNKSIYYISRAFLEHIGRGGLNNVASINKQSLGKDDLEMIEKGLTINTSKINSKPLEDEIFAYTGYFINSNLYNKLCKLLSLDNPSVDILIKKLSTDYSLEELRELFVENDLVNTDRDILNILSEVKISLCK